MNSSWFNVPGSHCRHRCEHGLHQWHSSRSPSMENSSAVKNHKDSIYPVYSHYKQIQVELCVGRQMSHKMPKPSALLIFQRWRCGNMPSLVSLWQFHPQIPLPFHKPCNGFIFFYKGGRYILYHINVNPVLDCLSVVISQPTRPCHF